MMNKKICLILICVIFLTLGAVSAADNVTDSDVISTDTTDNNIGDVENDNVLDASDENKLGDSGSYDDLEFKIDNATEGSTIYLNNDYTFEGSSASITINKKLTIDGRGYRINAGYNHKIFTVTGSNVTLKNIIFENGYASGNGGAVYWSGANGRIIDCSFINCEAGSGGAVYWLGNSGSITQSTFTQNYATNAGAVYWTGDNGNITDSEFINNEANNYGAVYWSGENGMISDSQFSENYAQYTTGAVYWSGYEGEISNCDFSNNYAESTAGAVYWYGNDGYITDSEFSDNTADASGGAIYWYGSNAIIEKSVFTANKASNSGGAIYFATDVSMEECEFYSNDAKENGGAVYISGSSSWVTDSIFDSNMAAVGGAVYWSGSDGSLTDSIFTNNVASTSGGAVYWDGDDGELNSTSFTNNIAPSAGAVYWYGDYAILYDDVFTSNGATERAGALYIYSVDATVSFCDFINNYVLEGHGGAVYKNYASFNEFINCNFINNTADYGGAMFVYTDIDDAIVNCNFNNNHAKFGDAIEWMGFLSTLTNSRFNNEKTGYDKYFYIDYKLIPNFNVMANDINLGNILRLDVNFTSFNESMCGNMDITIVNVYTDLIVYNSLQPLSKEIQLLVPNLKTGTYEILVNYTGDNIYESTLKTRVIEVSGIDTTIDFAVQNIKWGETVALNPTVTNGASGFIEIYVDGVYQDKFQVGTKYTLKGVGGPYSDITLIYLGSDNYKPSSKTKRVYVERLNTTLKVPQSVESGNPSVIEIGLDHDATGTLKVVFDGVTYKDDVYDGTFIFDAKYLTSGNKSMIIMYSGDSKYESFTKSFLINVTLKVPELYIDANNVLEGNNIVIAPYIDGATGNFEIYVNGEYVTQISSSSSCTLSSPSVGKYDIRVVYLGDAYFNQTESTTAVRVFDFYPIEITNPAIVYGSGRYFNATFYDEYGDVLVNKLVSFRVDGVDYVARTDVNGTAVLKHDFKIGNYTLEIINTVVNEGVAVPFKVFSSISSKDMTRAYNTSADYIVHVLGDDGNPLVKGWVIFNVNNKNYAVLTDNFGNATLNAHLLPGTYSITTTNALTCETKKNTVKIVQTLTASDTVRGYNSGSDFTARFVNIYNQPLVNQKVTFIINYTKYDLTTDSNGYAVLNEKLAVGKYWIEIINPVTDEVAEKNLTIVERITENKDVVCIPGQESYYTVRIIGDDGKVVGANEVVKITINDATNQIRTNDKGYASFKIPQLNMGSYRIYAEYKGYTVNNTIYVLQKVDNIKSIDVPDVSYKQNATITVTFHSFDYNADVEIIVTNSNGYKKVEKLLAHDSVSTTLSNLNASRYTVTVNYYDINTYKFANLTKTFNVLKLTPEMTVAVGNANVGDNATITVTIPDVTGQVSIKVGDKVVFEGAIKDGSVFKSIGGLSMGVYPVYVTYNGNTNYNSVSKSDTLVITQNRTLTNILSQDITMQYDQSANLVATLTDQYGNAVFGRNVSIYFNGINHVLTTGMDGTVRLLISNVTANVYDAVITFAGDGYYLSSTKTVKVTVTQPEKISLALKKVKVKRSAKKLVLKATLKINGKAAAKKVVKFKFNKKTYSAKTNSKGVAKVTIKKKVLKKLKKGKKVTYQAKYGSVTVKKTVKVKK